MKNFACALTFIFSALPVGMSLWGCSNAVPDLASVEAVVVYEYNSTHEPPRQRLSVFAQSSTDAARVMEIRVLHPEEKIQWDITEPVILHNGSKVWAGSANLMAPYYGPVPQGNYNIAYTDLAGETTAGDFFLNYTEIPEPSLSQPIFVDVPEEDPPSSQDRGSEPIRKIAIYSDVDGRGALLFFEEQNSEWKNFDDILQDYSGAKSLRICLDYPGRQVRYLLPFHNF